MKYILEKSRYIVLVGVVALLFAAVAASVWGAMEAFYAIEEIIISRGTEPTIVVSLIEVVDGFLVATAMLVFAGSLYQLFIGEVGLPNWMLAHNLHELKAKLSSVIILVMAVKFLEHLIAWNDPSGMLMYGGAIAVVVAVLVAFNYFGGED